jgi:hypothetical protein
VSARVHTAAQTRDPCCTSESELQRQPRARLDGLRTHESSTSSRNGPAAPISSTPSPSPDLPSRAIRARIAALTLSHVRPSGSHPSELSSVQQRRKRKTHRTEEAVVTLSFRSAVAPTRVEGYRLEACVSQSGRTYSVGRVVRRTRHPAASPPAKLLALSVSTCTVSSYMLRCVRSPASRRREAHNLECRVHDSQSQV